MLRITTDMTERAATLILEGRLDGVWVPELERCWHTVRAAQPDQPICVDMRAQTFADTAGKQLLRFPHDFYATERFGTILYAVA